MKHPTREPLQILLLALALGGVGCSVSVTTTPTTCPFAGSYDVSATPQGGSCPDGLPPETWSLAPANGGADFDLSIPDRPEGARIEDLSFDGTSCTATWRIVEPPDPACPSTQQTESYSAVFDGDGIHGTVNLSAACLPTGETCDGSFSFRGGRE